MLGRKQPQQMQNRPADTVISAGTTLEGRFEASGTVRIDGAVKGSLRIEGMLLVGPEAVIEADVEAVDAQVEGSIRGNVVARESLSLLPGSRLEGDVFTQCFRIEDGAVFKGNCHMGETRIEEVRGNSREEARL